MDNLKNAWEKRASEKGSTLEGVLYRGLGPDLNQYIHQWHLWVVRNRLLAHLPINARILDFGTSNTFSADLWKWVLNDEVWRAMFGAEMIPAVLFLILLFFVPESPRWLMVKNREEQALQVLNRVIEKEEATQEITEIKKVLKQETASWKQLLAPGIRVALFIGMALAILSQFSGTRSGTPFD